MTSTRFGTSSAGPRTPGDVSGGPPWLDLQPDAATPRRAREWTRTLLAAWDLSHLADDAELAVSELVTNAVQASSAAGVREPVRVCVATIGTHLLVQVRDYCPAFPVHRSPDDTEEAGRGMMIVGQISTEVGWYPTPSAPGKVVWCLVTRS